MTSFRLRRPCKSLSRGNRVLLTRASEERARRTCQSSQRARCFSAVGSCLRRTGHPFAVSGPGGPSQKIECVFSASPETIRREPREFDLRRSVGKWQDLAACALCDLYVLLQAEAPRPPLSGNFLRARSPVLPDLRRADTRPSFELRPESLDWHSLSAFLFRRPEPGRDPVWAPTSRLPPAPVGYACCAVWKAGCASPYRRSFFPHRRARSN